MIRKDCRKLKSATAACDLLSSISKMAGSSDGVVQRQIMGKLDSILHHFSREMHAATDIFHNQKVAQLLEVCFTLDLESADRQVLFGKGNRQESQAICDCNQQH